MSYISADKYDNLYNYLLDNSTNDVRVCILTYILEKHPDVFWEAFTFAGEKK